ETLLDAIIGVWTEATVDDVWLWKAARKHGFSDTERDAKMAEAEAATDARIDDWTTRLKRRFNRMADGGGNPDDIARVASLIRAGFDTLSASLAEHIAMAESTIPPQHRRQPVAT